MKKKRGKMSQKVAAERWGIPLATLGAIEQGVVRNYRPSTLAPLDDVLGRSTWDLYMEPDEPETLASQDELDELRRRLDDLAAEVAAVTAMPAPGGELESLAQQLGDNERAEVVSFAHFVLARRRHSNGSA